MEEVDSVGRKRTSKEGDSERRLKVEFLRQLDIVAQQDEEVAFVGTTNLPWELDIAFMRRFERKVFLPLLNDKERVELLKNALNEFRFSEKELESLKNLTVGLSGAELVNLVRAVMIKSKGGKEMIQFPQIEKIVKNFQPSVSKGMMSSYIKFVGKHGEREQVKLVEKNLYKEDNLGYIM